MKFKKCFVVHVLRQNYFTDYVSNITHPTEVVFEERNNLLFTV